MLDVEGFILVGGASRRMGSDKAQLMFGARTGVERIASELRSHTDRVRLVGARAENSAAGFENVPDVFEAWGALGGIHSALAASRAEWSIIVACDLPMVTSELFARLRHLTDSAFDAVVPIQADGRPQPLCAIYRRDPALSVSEKLIAMDKHTPRALLKRIRTRWVEFREVVDLPGAEHFFLNVNTPADYELAKQIVG